MDSQLRSVLGFFHRGTTTLTPTEKSPVDEFLKTCLDLCQRDYEIDVISNKELSFCPTYPDVIILLNKEKFRTNQGHADNSDGLDWKGIAQVIESCKDARVRSRFPVPVILWRNKLVCRSSTLSRGAEMVFRGPKEKTKELISDVYGFCLDHETNPLGFIDKMRTQDIQLLKQMNIVHICDLMVEDKKSYYGLSVCSSEKADNRGRYRLANFKLSAIPYPGVEFFSKFKESNYDVRNLFFDWKLSGADAQIKIAKTGDVLTDWNTYKDWDIIKLTQKYLQYIFQCMIDGDSKSGVLIHCISGWDRTPLFVSLIRILLWAEGECHPSLQTDEMLYLTLTYDWFLFCHQFAARFAKGEEIMYFCFRILRELLSDEYSLCLQVEQLKKFAEQNAVSDETRQDEFSMSPTTPQDSVTYCAILSADQTQSQGEEKPAFETQDGPRENPNLISVPSSIASAIQSDCTKSVPMLKRHSREADKHTPESSHGSWEMVGQYFNKYRAQLPFTNFSDTVPPGADCCSAEQAGSSPIPRDSSFEQVFAEDAQRDTILLSPHTAALFSTQTPTERSERLQQRRERIQAISHRFEALYGEVILGSEQQSSSWSVLSWLQ